jgi:hypothetical protein
MVADFGADLNTDSPRKVSAIGERSARLTIWLDRASRA